MAEFLEFGLFYFSFKGFTGEKYSGIFEKCSKFLKKNNIIASIIILNNVVSNLTK